jgi:transposase
MGEVARMGRPNTALVISEADREQLRALVRSQSMPHALVRRAQIVLLSGEGSSNREVARRCGVSAPVVSHWRRRYQERGLAGLHDELRPGRPRTHDDEQVAELINLVVQQKPAHATHWSVRAAAQASGIAKSTVGRYFALFGLPPHRSKSFKLSTDPFFVEKVPTSSVCTSIRPTRPWCCLWTRRVKYKRWSVLSLCCRWGWATSKG